MDAGRVEALHAALREYLNRYMQDTPEAHKWIMGWKDYTVNHTFGGFAQITVNFESSLYQYPDFGQGCGYKSAEIWATVASDVSGLRPVSVPALSNRPLYQSWRLCFCLFYAAYLANAPLIPPITHLFLRLLPIQAQDSRSSPAHFITLEFGLGLSRSQKAPFPARNAPCPGRFEDLVLAGRTFAKKQDLHHAKALTGEKNNGIILLDGKCKVKF